MEGKTVRRMIFILFFLLLFILVMRLFYPFLTILLWSGLIYALLAPLFNKFAVRKNGSERSRFARSLMAGALSLGGVLVFMVPLFFLGMSMIRQVGDAAGSAIHFLERHPEFFDLSPQGTLGGIINRVTDGAIDLSSIDLRGELTRFFVGSANRILGISGALLKNTASFILTLSFMVFTSYFFFVDGGHLIKVLVGAIPIEKEYTRLFLRKFRDTSRQLVVGFFLVAVYQAVAAFIIFSIFQIKGSLVLAGLTAVASFIPMVGTGLVWAPISLARVFSGDVAGGIALFVVSAFFISTLDNFIRPFLLGERLQLHPLLIFFSILGGLSIFGFNGLILGPLILILFFTGVGLFDKVYTREGGEQG